VVEEINGILERARCRVVVLGRHEDVGVEGRDLRRPCLGVLVGVPAHNRRHRLVEERQIEVFDVHEIKLGVAALSRDFVNPFGHGLAPATGPRASDDDGNSKHKFILCGFQMRGVCPYESMSDGSVAPADQIAGC
jgi:hypothetical protein